MPLSKHEQQLLDQMEQALYAEDPRFATQMKGVARRGAHKRHLIGGLGRTSRYRFARIVHVNVELSPQLYWRVVLKYRNERTEDVEDRPLGASERMVGLKSAAMRSAERIEALLVAEPSP